MAHYLLYSNTTSETGRVLKNRLGIHGSTHVPDNRQVDTLIRWGSSSRVARRPARVVNSRGAVERATNKLESLLRLAAEGVTVPHVFPAADPRHIPPAAFPLLGRRSSHTQGSDIKLCMQRSDAVRCLSRGEVEFFTRYIPTNVEFRVHVSEGGQSVLKISEKTLTDEARFQHPWVRNLGNGFTFRQPHRFGEHDPIMQRVRTEATRAVAVLGLDFGAVDVLVGDDGSVSVLEVNTGPSLGDSSLEDYVAYFAQILGVTPAQAPADGLPMPPEDELELLNP